MIMTISRTMILLRWRQKLHVFRLMPHTVLIQVVVVAAAVVMVEGFILALVIFVALIGGRNFLVVHDALLLEVLEILMLMIIPIIVMNREEAPMVTVVVMMLMVVLILATLEIMVTTSLANMVDTMINVAVIMNTAKMKMVWVKLKCPFPLSAERRMLMFILNGRPRWTRYLICIITQLQRRQSLLPLSLKVML
jgi:hypothetical protein